MLWQRQRQQQIYRHPRQAVSNDGEQCTLSKRSIVNIIVIVNAGNYYAVRVRDHWHRRRRRRIISILKDLIIHRIESRGGE